MAAPPRPFRLRALPHVTNPVFSAAAGQWDNAITEFGNIFYDSTLGKYVLSYSGYPDDDTASSVGVATSTDGITWTRLGHVITDPTEDPFIVKSGTTYYLYCEDKTGNTHTDTKCYTSADLSTWSDQGDAIQRGSVGQWDASDVTSPTVIKDGSQWIMMFEGRGSGQVGQVGVAFSSDGTSWTKYASNPVITSTNFGGRHQEFVPDSIFKDGDYYYLTLHYRIVASGVYRIAMLRSKNAINWELYVENMISDSVTGGNSQGDVQVCLLADGSDYRYYYGTAQSPTSIALGYAEPQGTLVGDTGTSATKVVSKDYPAVEGLIAGSTKQTNPENLEENPW